MTVSIAIDAMGGDRAPREVVHGAVRAALEIPDIHLFLVGQEDRVREELALLEWQGDTIDVVPAETVIAMSDSPVESLSKKRGSSIEVASRLVRTKEASAFVSAGNTGACVAAASLFLGRLKPVKRPGIAVVLQTGGNPVTVIDVGANINCKPEHLLQYAVMASIYSEEILGLERPRVGLMNIGEEDEKGHALAKQTHSLFLQTGLNYHGNVEGADLFRGELGVVVCDGFVGNIVLKVAEGLAERLLALFMGAITQGLRELPDSPTIMPVVQKSFEDLLRTLDYSEYGGAPLLGVNGTVIIAHGRSDSKAIVNAIKLARRMAVVNLNSRITDELQKFTGK